MVEHSTMYLPFILLATIFSVQGRFSMDSLFSKDVVPHMINAIASLIDSKKDSPTRNNVEMNSLANDVYLAETLFNTALAMCPAAVDGKLSGLLRESIGNFHTSWKKYNSANVTVKKETRKLTRQGIERTDKDVDGVDKIHDVTEKVKVSRQDICARVKKALD